MNDVYVSPLKTDSPLIAGEVCKVSVCSDAYWIVQNEDKAVQRDQSAFRFVTADGEDVVNQFLMDPSSFNIYIPFYLRCIREREFELARALWNKVISTAQGGSVDTFVRFPVFLPTGELSISDSYVWDGKRVYSKDASLMRKLSMGDCREFSAPMQVAYNLCTDIKSGWLPGISVASASDETDYAKRVLSALPSALADDSESDINVRALKAVCEFLGV